MSVEIKLLEAADVPRWDAFVRAQPCYSLYHLTAWKSVLERVFPVRSVYLYAERDGHITAILPLIQQNSLLFGNRFTSLPFCTYGGVRSSDPDSERELLREAVRFVAEAGGRYLELREVREIADIESNGNGSWRVGRNRITLLLPLNGSLESVLRQMDGTRRYDIRKACKNGLQFELAGIERLSNFYNIYARNMRDLGSPAYPKKFFRAMLETFDEEFRLAFVVDRGTPVAAGLLSRWNDTLEIPYASALRTYKQMSPTALLYWGSIAHAFETGCRIFDFGRSLAGSGTHKYKMKFGASEQRLPWLYWLPPGKGMPSLNRDEPRFKPLIRAWQHLPLWFANWLGPWVSSRLY